MMPLYFISLSFLSLVTIAVAKTYYVQVTTGRSTFAGTSEDVRIILYGTKGRAESTFNGFGVRFENGRTDNLQLNGQDIGSLIEIEVQIIKTLLFVDNWDLNRVKVSFDGDEYEGYFNYIFRSNRDIHKTRRFQINRCRKGYEQGTYGNRITCQDRNECKTTCKASGEKCKNTNGGYVCSCKAGYISDGAGCRDYNECANPDLDPCNFPNAYCTNLPGSYECKCNSGYIGSYHSCQDRNECSLNAHDCSQKCINVPGSYKCGCNKGFRLAVDLKTCVDVDECSSKDNICDTKTSVCYDEQGSYRCVCKTGFKPHKTKPNVCVPKQCDAPTGLDKNLILSPESCMKNRSQYGQECIVSCKEGYYLSSLSSRSLVCENGPFNGFRRVNGSIPLCQPKLCPKIVAPANAFTVPAKCSSIGTEHGQDCHIFCDTEFILAGNRKYHCSNEKYDKDPSKVFCTKVPRIYCPKDVTIVLPGDKDRIALNNAFPNYESNMRMDQVTSNIPNLGPEYEFKKGTNMVIYTAKNELNQTDSCAFAVKVLDISPPSATYCPPDQYLVSKGGASVNVTWKEPRFSDNVGVTKVSESAKSGEMHPPTSFTVHYTAEDEQKNFANCKFKIHFKVLSCNFDSIRGGDQLVQKMCVNVLGSQAICMAHCPSGKTFDVINSKSPIKYMWNCQNADFGIDRMPDCVEFQNKKDKKCPAGYLITKNYRVFNGPDVCGKCPRGTYYIQGKCMDCPRNTYQDQEGSLTCNKCPATKGTFRGRNIHVSSCKALCLPGYISQNGMDAGNFKCKICPVNTYASKHGSTECSKCPNGTTTEGPGRTSIHDCLSAPYNVTMVPSDTIEASVGDSVYFDCYTQGNPLPFLHIIKVGSKPNPATHGLVTVGSVGQGIKGLRYLITKVSKFDAGNYVCRAENKKGIVHKKIQLIVDEGSGMGSGMFL